MKQYKLFWDDIFLGKIKESNFDHRSSGSIAIDNLNSLKTNYSKLFDLIQFSIKSSSFLDNGDVENYEKIVEKENDFLNIINSKNWYLINELLEKTEILCPIFHSETELTWQIDIDWLLSTSENKKKLFENEIIFLEGIKQFKNRRLLTKEEVQKITIQYKGVPQTYLNYLFELGIGEIMAYSLNFFERLISLDSIGIYEHYHTHGNILFFCTDFKGKMYGFDLDNNFDIIELDQETAEYNSIGKSFRQLIREKIEMNE